jgi:hypothetical protein
MESGNQAVAFPVIFWKEIQLAIPIIKSIFSF